MRLELCPAKACAGQTAVLFFFQFANTFYPQRSGIIKPTTGRLTPRLDIGVTTRVQDSAFQTFVKPI